jgi:hypothetical protein
MNMNKLKYQIISFDVTEPGQKKTINTNTKVEHDRITGVFVSIQKDSSVASSIEVGSTMGLSIDSEEIFPDKFEVGNLTKQVAVDINNLPHVLDEKARNSPVKVIYQDGNSPAFPAGGYKVNIYLRATEVERTKTGR